MRARRLMVAGVALLVLLAASHAVVLMMRPSVDEAEAEQLTAVADRWWSELPADSGWVTIPEGRWPAEIRRLDPESVRIAANGVYIQRGSLMVAAWGWFILPTGSKFQPTVRGDPSYKPLQGRVYWYEIKG